jgi:hypothetical protein
MAYTPLGAQPGTAGNDSRHQLVGMQAAFHQCLDFAAGGKSGTTLGCCMPVRHVLDAQALQLDPCARAIASSLARGAIRTGSISPSRCASSAADRLVASQGWTTPREPAATP